MALASKPSYGGASAVLALGCVLGAVVFLGVGTWGTGEVQAGPGSDHVHSGLGSSAPRLPDQVNGNRRPVVAGPGAQMGPASSVGPSAAGLMLDAYYGPDASAVRAALARQGINPDELNAPVSEAEFQTFLPHWMALSLEEREARKRQEHAWPDPLTNAFLQSEFGLAGSLGSDELATIDSIAKLHAPDIDAAVDQYFDHLDVALAMELGAGRVRSSPFLVWPTAQSDPDGVEMAHSGTVFYSLMRSGQGWIARAALGSGDHPEAYVARASIAAALGIRNHAIIKSLADLQQ